MIKAIETIYNGYRFRSRLEARWAVFFDTLGIDYQYEPEGYDLGNYGYYLPDFWLHTNYPNDDSGIYIEIKPIEMTSQELAKLYVLAKNTKVSALAIQGQPYPTEHEITFLAMWDDIYGPHRTFSKPRITRNLQFVQFVEESKIYLWSKQLVTYQFPSPGFCSFSLSILESAFLAARQARFEHGENGRR